MINLPIARDLFLGYSRARSLIYFKSDIDPHQIKVAKVGLLPMLDAHVNFASKQFPNRCRHIVGRFLVKHAHFDRTRSVWIVRNQHLPEFTRCHQ